MNLILLVLFFAYVYWYWRRHGNRRPGLPRVYWSIWW